MKPHQSFDGVSFLGEYMEFEERDRLLRRINNRGFSQIITYNNQEIPIYFNDPTIAIKVKADPLIKKYKDEAKEANLPTLKESYEILKSQGIWSDEKEKELELIKGDIKIFTERLSNVKFKKLEEKALKSAIEKLKTRMAELEKIRNQLYTKTAEFYSDQKYRRFIMANVCTVPNEHKYLLEMPAFLDTLSVLYYSENAIREKEIREIARTSPWILYWRVAKDLGTELFPHSLIEMTDYQYALLNWTKLYEFAYDSQNRPSDDIIHDDDKFDAWYNEEIDRLNRESKNKEVQSSLGGKSGSQEVFIPADREGAKEVYNLNDRMIRNKLTKRQEMILKEGVVNHANLPDVKSEIIMEANRLASASIKKRG